jgi:hypothetical protein
VVVRGRLRHKATAPLAFSARGGNLHATRKKTPKPLPTAQGFGALPRRQLSCSTEVRAPTGLTQPVPLTPVSTQKTPALSPVASLCLGVVRGWLRVVQRGRGGELRNGVPYTRLKASEVQQQLEAEYSVAVSTKTVQRALTQLVTGGHLSRRQLYKHRYNRTYWYAPGELEQKAEGYRPRSVAAQFQGRSTPASSQSPQPGQPEGTEGSPVSLQALQAQLPSSTHKAASSQTAKQPQTGEAPCGQPKPQQEAVSRAWGRTRRTATAPRTEAHSGRLQQAQQRLAEVVQRAAAYRGFGSKPSTPTSKLVQPVAYKAESPQAAGFIR